jgi:hypothetical protein
MKFRVMTMTVLTTAVIMATMAQFLPAGVTKEAAKADERVKAALEKMDWKYKVDEDGDFKVVMKLKDGRTQMAWITSKVETVGGLEIREVMSPGYAVKGPLSAEVANQLLMNSSRKKLGSWRVANSQDKSLALFSVKVSANLSPEDLETALVVALHSADEMEKALSQEDKF